MIVEVACVMCGGAFQYDQAGRGRRRRTCSATCQAARNLALNQKYRREGRYPRRTRAKTIAKICAVCSVPFMASDRKRQACGPVCGNVLGKINGDIARKRNAQERRQRTCENCGAGFVAHNPSGQARAGRSKEGRFCSRRCAAVVQRHIRTVAS